MKQVTDILSRIPFIVLGLLYMAYMAYDFYDFNSSTDSELGIKKAQLVATKAALEGSKKRLNSAQEFFKNLDVIRARIRTLSQQLENTKSSLTGDVDLANFIRMVTLEAKKVGLNIQSIRPMADVKKDYYIEVPFSISFKGAYVQVLVFLDRMVRLQQLVRITGFDLRPVGSTLAKYVELSGSGTIKTYKYVGSHADDVTTKEWMKSNEEGLKSLQSAPQGDGKK